VHAMLLVRLLWDPLPDMLRLWTTAISSAA
jgi:hypothetical protein